MKIVPRRVQVALVDGALTILGLALLCFGVWAVWKENLGLAGTALGSGLVLLFAATIHRFESLKGLGMEAKTRKLDETIDKAELALDKLKELTELVGANLIKLSSSVGRFGGAPSLMEAYALSRQVKRTLEGIGASDAAVRDALRPWARVAAIDLFYSQHEPLRLLIDKSRLELGRVAALPSAAGEQAAALMARIHTLDSFLFERFGDISSWRLEDFSRRLLDRLNTVPEIEESQRVAFNSLFRKAASQLDALASTLDFADQEYWRAIERANEQ